MAAFAAIARKLERRERAAQLSITATAVRGAADEIKKQLRELTR